MTFLLPLFGIFIFFSGFVVGAIMQYRMDNRMPPPLANLFKSREKLAVADEDAVEPDPIHESFRAAMQDGTDEEIAEACSFYGVSWDNRREKRGQIVDQLVEAKFNPGAMRL